MNFAKGVDKSRNGGIIKSIDVDDFKVMANAHEMKEEVTNTILNTIREYEKMVECIYPKHILEVFRTKLQAKRR